MHSVLHNNLFAEKLTEIDSLIKKKEGCYESENLSLTIKLAIYRRLFRSI